ncbi:hypothetical protein PG997_007248 [Apiospora hydei]|uniref:Uncharacterized protein n=1 Tax=Apiospora hydei TaxID=1337664 RepID=A0ABR1WAD9_9PEZI
MASAPLLVALFAGMAASLPQPMPEPLIMPNATQPTLPVDVIPPVIAPVGNLYNPFCAYDACATMVIGALLPTPSQALKDCSAFLALAAATAVPASTYTSTLTATTSAAPVTLTVTQTLSTTVVDNVSETDTVTSTVQVLSTAFETSLVTVTGQAVVSTTVVETSTLVETDTATLTTTAAATTTTAAAITITFTDPGKRDLHHKEPKKHKRGGACRHTPGTSASASASSSPSSSSSDDSPSAPSSTTTSTTASTTGPACADAAQYVSACQCAYVTAPTNTDAASTVVTVTETVFSTDSAAAIEVSSFVQPSTVTEFVTATAEVTSVVPGTTVETVSDTLTSTEVLTTTTVLPSTTTATVVSTATPSPTACSQPQHFFLQVASGSHAGQYIYTQGDVYALYLSTNVAASTGDGPVTFSFRPQDGVLLLDKVGAPVFYDTSNPASGAVTASGLPMVIPVPATGGNPTELHALAGSGPGCPGASGEFSSDESQNGGRETFLLCNGFLYLSVDGQRGACPGEYEVVTLNYVPTPDFVVTQTATTTTTTAAASTTTACVQPQHFYLRVLEGPAQDHPDGGLLLDSTNYPVFYDGSNPATGILSTPGDPGTYPVPATGGGQPKELQATTGGGPGCPRAVGPFLAMSTEKEDSNYLFLCNNYLYLTVDGSHADCSQNSGNTFQFATLYYVPTTDD